MTDTTQVASEMRRMITDGTSERELLAFMTRWYPDLTLADLSRATKAAEEVKRFEQQSLTASSKDFRVAVSKGLQEIAERHG